MSELVRYCRGCHCFRRLEQGTSRCRVCGTALRPEIAILTVEPNVR